MTSHPLVIVESPYAGDVEANVDYARACLRDCILRGETPFASHLLYTQPGVLDDAVPEQRMRGIEMGYQWAKKADFAVFYIDRGYSNGMTAAKLTYKKAGLPCFERSLTDALGGGFGEQGLLGTGGGY